MAEAQQDKSAAGDMPDASELEIDESAVGESTDDKLSLDEGRLSLDKDATAGDLAAMPAAKAKQGEEAVEAAKRVVEELDGAESGFLDTNELIEAIESLKVLSKEITRISERLDNLEAVLKDKGILES